MKKLSIFICALFAVATVSAQRVAVLDFNAGVGVSQADVDGISAIFNTYFSPRGYTLVERTQIDRVIDEQNFQRGKLTQTQMVRIGQILNVSKVVIGDVNIVMNQYNVDVRVVNVESGTISAKDGATWAPGSSYRTMMSQLGTRLASQIAINPTANTQSAVSQYKTWKVGDLYDVNGKQGIVYVVTPDGKHGKIVSLTMFPQVLNWSSAKSWCNNLGSGWRLPTKDELLVIYKVQGVLNQVLTAVGDEIPGNFHWSLTEYNADCAWLVLMYNGATDYGNKGNDNGYVRAVCAF